MAITAPTDIDDCVLWLKADAGIATSDATGRVSTWADQSVAENDFAQATTTRQPYIYTDPIFGARVAFDPDDAQRHWLENAMAIDTQAFSVFVVHRIRNSQSSNIVPYFNNSTGAGAGALLSFNGVPCVYNTGSSAIRYSSNRLCNNLDFSGYCSGASGIDIHSGHVKTSLAAISQQNTTYASLGRWNSDTAGLLRGDIYEVFAFSRKLSASEQDDVLAYMQSKWGIMPATANIMMIGDSITAGVGASEGQNLVYYLEKNIPGGCRVINRARSGFTWADIAQVDALTPSGDRRNILVAFAGTNDISGGATPAEAYASKDTTLEPWLDLGWEPIVVHMIPRETDEVARNQYNALLSAGEETIVSWDDVPQIDQGFLTFFTEDEIHPTSDGYAIIGPQIARTVNKLLSPDTASVDAIVSAINADATQTAMRTAVTAIQTATTRTALRAAIGGTWTDEDGNTFVLGITGDAPE